MKRLINVLVIFSVFFSLVVFQGAAIAADNEPPLSEEFDFLGFLPFLSGTVSVTHTVTGTVTDADSIPVADVLVMDETGISTTTDALGNFSLELLPGENTLFALKAGYSFAPEELAIVVEQDLSAQNFNATLGCGNIVVNGTLDYHQGGWDFPIADYWNFSTAKTVGGIFHSTPYSARTGILSSWLPPTEFDGSNSYGVSQVYHIPDDASSAYISMWVYRPSTSGIGESDRQYIRLVDEDIDDNVKLDLMWGIVNTPSWVYVEYPINTMIGERFRIQAGTINDGVGGVAALYFDDVTLVVCTSAPPPSGCTNLVSNSSFEVPGYWTAVGGQVTPPVFTNALAAFGSRSVRTGLRLVDPNEQSNSEFYQDVFVPQSAGSLKVSFYVYTYSGEVTTAPSAEPSPSMLMAPLTPSIDTQYMYVFDPDDGLPSQKLIWWAADDNEYWRYMEFYLPVEDFALDKELRILFGTYNDGLHGKTAMWIDEVRLEICPDGTPTPGPGCYEAFNNRSFETNSEWEIPATAFKARYSTLQAFVGSRSMQAGIYNKSDNVYSYSDFYDQVTIPSNTDEATLTFQVWMKSLDPDADARASLDARTLPEGVNVSELAFAPDSNDLQYLLVLDKYGNILKWKWTKLLDRQSWNLVTLDMTEFKGKTVRFQWGVYNNGDYLNKVTSMFVDSASLIICDP